MATPKMTIGIRIGKEDDDVLNWFNMLRENGLSLSLWVSQLIMAYVNNVEIDIGTIAVKKRTTGNVTTNTSNTTGIMFGVGSSASSDKQLPKKKSKAPYKENDLIQIRIYNKNAEYALKALRERGQASATVIKRLIRRYAKYGQQSSPPTRKAIEETESNELFNCIDRSELIRPTTTKEEQEQINTKQPAKKNNVAEVKEPVFETPLKQIQEETGQMLTIQNSTSDESTKTSSVPKKNPLLGLI